MSIEVPFKEQTEHFSETVKEKLILMMLLLLHVFLGGGKKGEENAEASEISCLVNNCLSLLFRTTCL
jgi:hypothetical protein